MVVQHIRAGFAAAEPGAGTGKDVQAHMDTPKYRIVLASHGEQAKGMLNTVQMLLGPQKNIVAHCLYPEQTVADLTKDLQAEIEHYGAENIIFMTELMFGSPFNAVVSLTRDRELYHITGTNLATLMAVIMARDDEDATGEDICEAAIEAAQGSIKDVKKLLAEQSDGEEEEDL